MLTETFRQNRDGSTLSVGIDLKELGG